MCSNIVYCTWFYFIFVVHCCEISDDHAAVNSSVKCSSYRWIGLPTAALGSGAFVA